MVIGYQKRRDVSSLFHKAARIFILALLLMGSSPAAWAGTQQPIPPDAEVFAVALRTIDDFYLQPVDLRQLTLDGLNGLQRLEPQFVAVTGSHNGTAAMELRLQDQSIGFLTEPSSDDAEGWAALMRRAVMTTRKNSKPLAGATNEAVYQAVLNGVTHDLDIYSRYSGAGTALAERAARNGDGGIGVILTDTVSANGGEQVTIAEVLPHSPAAQAEIHSGDILIALQDGREDSSPKPLPSPARLAAAALHGPVGSMVEVTLASSDVGLRKLSLIREREIPASVSLNLTNGIAELKLRRFNAATLTSLREALAGLAANNTSPLGLILDLRGNTGGLLDQAIGTVQLFISHGLILYTEGRHPDSRQRYDADTMPDASIPSTLPLGTLPLIVLIDEKSASSAEAVAAALQDNGRAVVIGSPSYGKGSVQTVTRLPNDGELFLTWARLHAPSDYSLNHRGVMPQICVGDPAAVNAAALLDQARLHTDAIQARVTAWRAANATALDDVTELRAQCPVMLHDPAIENETARALLADHALYHRLLLPAAGMVAER